MNTMHGYLFYLGPDKLRIMVLVTLSNSIFLVLVHKLLLVVTYEH